MGNCFAAPGRADGKRRSFVWALTAKETFQLSYRLLPSGSQPVPDDVAGRVALFYAHPTLSIDTMFFSAQPHISPSEADSLLRRQLGPFLGLGPVSAPAYRNATLWAYFSPCCGGCRNTAFERAYRDLERAFEDFLAALPAGMPFILAGHSQGADHMVRLLQRRFESGAPDAAELRRRLVAAYLAGCQVGLDTFRVLQISKCATDLGAAVPWATTAPPRRHSDMATGKVRRDTASYSHFTVAPVSVNPLSWRLDADANGPPAASAAHPGALLPWPPGSRWDDDGALRLVPGACGCAVSGEAAQVSDGRCIVCALHFVCCWYLYVSTLYMYQICTNVCFIYMHQKQCTCRHWSR